jgi:hypothetical protein
MNGMVGAGHGRGMASVNQIRPRCVNQMGKTHSKPLAARHGRGTAWSRHAMCESALTQQPSTSNGTETKLQELRARRAEIYRRYNAKKKEEWLVKRRVTSTEQNIETASTVPTNSTVEIVRPEQSTSTQQPPTSHAAQSKSQDARARRAEYARRYRAKKKEEKLTKTRGITSANKTNMTEITCNTQDTLLVRSTPSINVTVGSTHHTDMPCCTQQIRMMSEQTGIKLENIDVEERRMILAVATWRSFEHDISYERCWNNAEDRFHQTFMHLRFDDACSVCDRLWCDTQLRSDGI